MTDHPKKELTAFETANVFVRAAANATLMPDRAEAALQTVIKGVKDASQHDFGKAQTLESLGKHLHAEFESFRKHSPEEFAKQLKHQQQLTLEAKATHPGLYNSGAITGSVMVGLAALNVSALAASRGAIDGFAMVTKPAGWFLVGSAYNTSSKIAKLTMDRAAEDLDPKPAPTPPHKGHTKATRIT